MKKFALMLASLFICVTSYASGADDTRAQIQADLALSLEWHKVDSRNDKKFRRVVLKSIKDPALNEVEGRRLLRELRGWVIWDWVALEQCGFSEDDPELGQAVWARYIFASYREGPELPKLPNPEYLGRVAHEAWLNCPAHARFLEMVLLPLLYESQHDEPFSTATQALVNRPDPWTPQRAIDQWATEAVAMAMALDKEKAAAWEATPPGEKAAITVNSARSLRQGHPGSFSNTLKQYPEINDSPSLFPGLPAEVLRAYKAHASASEPRGNILDPFGPAFEGPGAEGVDRLMGEWLTDSDKVASLNYERFIGIDLYKATKQTCHHGLYRPCDSQGFGVHILPPNKSGRDPAILRMKDLQDRFKGALAYSTTNPIIPSNDAFPNIGTAPLVKVMYGEVAFVGEIDEEGHPHGVGVAIWPSKGGLYLGHFDHGRFHGFGGHYHRSEAGEEHLNVGNFVAGRGLVGGTVHMDISGDEEMRFTGTFENGRLEGLGQRDAMGSAHVLEGLVEAGHFKAGRLMLGATGTSDVISFVADGVVLAGDRNYVNIETLEVGDVVRLEGEAGVVVMINTVGTKWMQVDSVTYYADDPQFASFGPISYRSMRHFAQLVDPDTPEAIAALEARAEVEAEYRAEAKRRHDRRMANLKLHESEGAGCVPPEQIRYTAEGKLNPYRHLMAGLACPTYSPGLSVTPLSSGSSSPSVYTKSSDPYGGLNPWDSQYQTLQKMADPSRYYQNRY